MKKLVIREKLDGLFFLSVDGTEVVDVVGYTVDWQAGRMGTVTLKLLVKDEVDMEIEKP